MYYSSKPVLHPPKRAVYVFFVFNSSFIIHHSPKAVRAILGYLHIKFATVQTRAENIPPLHPPSKYHPFLFVFLVCVFNSSFIIRQGAAEGGSCNLGIFAYKIHDRANTGGKYSAPTQK